MTTAAARQHHHYHHLEVAAATAAVPLDRTISLNVHNRHGGGTGTASGGGGGGGCPAPSQQLPAPSSLKDRWYSFRYRPGRGSNGAAAGDRHHHRRRSNVEEFLFMESLPDAPAAATGPNAEGPAGGGGGGPDGSQEIELSIIIRKDTIRRDLLDSMRTCNGRPVLMELVEEHGGFDADAVHPPPNRDELDRLLCWAVYIGAPAECLDALYELGASTQYSHCGSFTAMHLAAFMGNADALR